MQNIESLIRSRKSVRTYDSLPLTPEELAQLTGYMENASNPYGLPVAFRLLNVRQQNLSCPVVVGTDLFAGAKVKKAPYFNEAVGYSVELLMLRAQSLGIGTVWIGGTMDRAAFERAMELEEDEVMPCVTPLGHPAKKPSLRDIMMRKAIKADERMPFESLFFDGSFSSPLKKESAGLFAHPLEMVRLAPSAVNRQPWRIVIAGNSAHFYLKRAKGFSGGTLDMQKIDLGIALCHFELAARESGLEPVFSLDTPGISAPDGEEYIASYHL